MDYVVLNTAMHPLVSIGLACLFPQVSLPLESNLTHTGQLGHVQLEALEAVAGVALLNTHTAAILTAIQDAALLCLQAFETSLVFWQVETRERKMLGLLA